MVGYKYCRRVGKAERAKHDRDSVSQLERRRVDRESEIERTRAPSRFFRFRLVYTPSFRRSRTFLHKPAYMRMYKPSSVVEHGGYPAATELGGEAQALGAHGEVGYKVPNQSDELNDRRYERE